ncbi:MAG: hypothetical protein ACSLFM_07905 [Tepidiformaceae bacterium]
MTRPTNKTMAALFIPLTVIAYALLVIGLTADDPMVVLAALLGIGVSIFIAVMGALGWYE